MGGSHDFFAKFRKVWRKTYWKWQYLPAQCAIVPIFDQVIRRCFVHVEQVTVTRPVDVIGRQLVSCDTQRKKIVRIEYLRIVKGSEGLPVALKCLQINFGDIG